MHSKDTQIKQYAHQYLTEILKLVLFLTVPISALFLVVALIYDVLKYDWICSFLPILFGLVVFVFCYIKTRHFAAMIRWQEDLLNVVFQSEPLTQLYPKTLFYQSDDWFIRAGCWGFHRDYIEKTSIHVRNEKSPARSYAIDIYTVDHQKIVIHDMQSGEINKFKLWLQK